MATAEITSNEPVNAATARAAGSPVSVASVPISAE
jgi:hypothetical protein